MDLRRALELASSVAMLNGIRAIYSTKFYQEIDWHCYSQFGQAILNGERDYIAMLCDFGYNVYPAVMSWLYAAIQWITSGEVASILVIHVVLWTLTAWLATLTYAPVMHRGRWIFLVLPFIAQSPFRAAISRVTNDTWVAFFTVLLHYFVQQKRFKAVTVTFAILLSLKMNSLVLAPAMLLIYIVELPLLQYVTLLGLK